MTAAGARRNIGAHPRCLDDMYRVANAGDEYLGRQLRIVENVDDFPHETHPGCADVVEVARRRGSHTRRLNLAASHACAAEKSA